MGLHTCLCMLNPKCHMFTLLPLLLCSSIKLSLILMPWSCSFFWNLLYPISILQTLLDIYTLNSLYESGVAMPQATTMVHGLPPTLLVHSGILAINSHGSPRESPEHSPLLESMDLFENQLSPALAHQALLCASILRFFHPLRPRDTARLVTHLLHHRKTRWTNLSIPQMNFFCKASFDSFSKFRFFIVVKYK